MKRILLNSYYYKPHFGGVENSLFYIANVIRENNNEAILVVSDADLTKKKRLPLEEEIDGIKIYRFKRFLPVFRLFILFAPFIDVYRCTRLVKKLHNEYNFQLAISRNHLTGIACMKANIRATYYIIPAILQLSDKYNKNSFLSLSLKNRFLIFYNNRILLKIQSHFQKAFANSCTHVLTLSKNMKKQTMMYLGIQENRITVHFPGVSIKHHEPIVGKDGKFRFVIVGRITGVKRIDLAIQAIKILNSKVYELHIVGDGPLKEDLRQMAIELGLQESVFFHKFTSDVGAYYAAADCFIMSSEYEAFGQTNLEAMSFGLPIIAFRPDGDKVRTASDEIIENGINGLLLDDISAEALAAAIEELLVDKAKIEIYRKNNLIKAKQFTWTDFLDTILKLSR